MRPVLSEDMGGYFGFTKIGRSEKEENPPNHLNLWQSRYSLTYENGEYKQEC